MNAGNTTDVVLQVSKIFRIIIDFDPVEFSSLSTQTPSALQQQPSNPWQQHLATLRQLRQEQQTSTLFEILSLSGLVDFFQGFFSGAQLSTSHDMTECEDTIDVKFSQNALLLGNRTLEFQLFDALFTLYDMLYNVDTLFNSCSKGFVDSFSRVAAYSIVY